MKYDKDGLDAQEERWSHEIDKARERLDEAQEIYTVWDSMRSLYEDIERHYDAEGELIVHTELGKITLVFGGEVAKEDPLTKGAEVFVQMGSHIERTLIQEVDPNNGAPTYRVQNTKSNVGSWWVTRNEIIGVPL